MEKGAIPAAAIMEPGKIEDSLAKAIGAPKQP
jgi:hypothetical protein